MPVPGVAYGGKAPPHLELLRVPDRRWSSYPDAAAALGISELHVLVLTHIEVLEVGIESNDERGVTRASLDAEHQRRQQHRRWRRAWRTTKGVVLNGI